MHPWELLVECKILIKDFLRSYDHKLAEDTTLNLFISQFECSAFGYVFWGSLIHASGEDRCSGILEEFSQDGTFDAFICMLNRGKTANLIAR